VVRFEVEHLCDNVCTDGGNKRTTVMDLLCASNCYNAV